MWWINSLANPLLVSSVSQKYSIRFIIHQCSNAIEMPWRTSDSRKTPRLAISSRITSTKESEQHSHSLSFQRSWPDQPHERVCKCYIGPGRIFFFLLLLRLLLRLTFQRLLLLETSRGKSPSSDIYLSGITPLLNFSYGQISNGQRTRLIALRSATGSCSHLPGNQFTRPDHHLPPGLASNLLLHHLL